MSSLHFVLPALALLAAVAPAQDLLLDEPHLPGDPDRGPDGWWSYVDAGVSSYRSAPLEGRAGSMDLDRYELSFDFERHGDDGVLDLSLDHSRQGYNHNWHLGGIERPLEVADHYRLQAAWHERGEQQLSWYVGARAEAGVHGGEDPFGEATLGATVGLEVELTEGLDLELSLDALERLEDDPRVVPLALVDWRLGEDLRLGRVAGGYGLDWGYDLETRYFLAVDQDERQFRLGQEAGGGGVVRDRERSVRAGMLWQPSADLRLELCLGQADRHMSLFEDDRRVDGFGVEDTAFFGVRLNFGPEAFF